MPTGRARIRERKKCISPSTLFKKSMSVAKVEWGADDDEELATAIAVGFKMRRGRHHRPIQVPFAIFGRRLAESLALTSPYMSLFARHSPYSTRSLASELQCFLLLYSSGFSELDYQPGIVQG